jgi:polyhydroxybutyrate depolymerase
MSDRRHFSLYRNSISASVLITLGCFSAGCRNAVVLNTPQEISSESGSASCPVGDRIEQIPSGGSMREYLLHVPYSLRGASSPALVLGFHGNGSHTGTFADYSGFSAVADREEFIMVYPQGMGEFPTWEINSVTRNLDVQFVRELIEIIQVRCNVDPSRIYATGHSRGGGMANRLGCDLSEHIAAIGPVSGTYPMEDRCIPARPVPVIAFHGDADPDVPYSGIKNQNGPPEAYFAFGIPIQQWASAWAARNGCGNTPATVLEEDYLTGRAWSGCRGGGDVVFYTIPGGGHGWPGGSDPGSGNFNTAQMIWDFFEAHPRA